jgi:hypothetical protein
MNKLVIYTKFPATVAALLKYHDLADGLLTLPAAGTTEPIEMHIGDDAPSQSLGFWLDIAKACALIEGYTFTHRLPRHP